jgi:XTP/dITP diphosphohydrolase
MQQVVFATFNRGKVREVGNLLAGLELEVLSPADFGISTLPLETGDTFLENAVIKASAVWQQLRIPVMADDSGLLVHALDGAPGVSSARYAGPDANDKANNLKLLEALSGETNRSAAFFLSGGVYS